MIELKNANYPQFLSETSDKRIICFGVGGTFRDFLRANTGKVSLTEKIDHILDNNPLDKVININCKRIAVETVSEFIQRNVDLSNYVVILAIANEYVIDVVAQLDVIPQFNDVCCYLGITAISWGREVYPPISSILPIPKNKYSIPKVIHCIWFGGSENMGEVEKECIESWKKYCPDYKLRSWDETNYDISATPLYVQQAYKVKKYAFVSDYARLDILYNYGGVYLDTDVELLGNIDNLLNYKAFWGFESYTLIATGLGFGSVSDNPVLRDLMEIYEQIIFSSDNGELNTTPCPVYHTEYFRDNGLKISNTLQVIDEMIFLPSDYFCPFNQGNVLYNFTKNTLSDHKFNVSWFNEINRNDWQSKISQLENINIRLKTDWRRGSSND